VWAVLTDFDGTIAEQDLAEVILARFADPEWKQYNERLSEGRLSVEESVTGQYSMIEARTQKEMVEYARSVYRLRPGFGEFLAECRSRGIPFAIVSAGLDFCIRDTFRTSGLPLPRLICPRSSFVPLKGVTLTFPRRRSAISRDFKDDAVIGYRRGGYRVVYVGDGAGDINAADRADIVFAVKGSRLERMCVGRKIPYRPMSTFRTLSSFVKRLKTS
jgi:2-hydroxy-3-keto-5-methylthiopentenyl-1-phosphate phosphatase